jgi:hypothetical protein
LRRERQAIVVRGESKQDFEESREMQAIERQAREP